VSAIVAKAINDSIGTEDFEGLNTILKGHLDEFSSSIESSIEKLVEELPPKVEGAVMSSASTILCPGSDLLYDVGLEAGLKTYKSPSQIGREITFKCNGAIRVNFEFYDSSVYDGIVYLKKNEEKTIIYKNGTYVPNGIIVPIVNGDKISFVVEGESGASANLEELKIMATVIPNAGLMFS
jgi:hypothetical protein